MAKKSSGTRADSGQGTIYFSDSRSQFAHLRELRRKNPSAYQPKQYLSVRTPARVATAILHNMYL